jgi:ribonuclease BN (tRNA processing enzyme)
VQHLTESHTDAKLVGSVAERAGARKLVLHHLSPGLRALTDASWEAKAQRGYSGTVHVGHDLDVLSL